ncbi:hypothetical protein CEXT_284741 [Caerostris extrusa]|uniref:Uncharacterized protein n=1 Tax=Caerostris extrusa TaxID=172846 RepID=A0AAV4QCJ1_CAEEX|nr:hypothetical protein CEXT_284741 [Caerostris extrusa]
MKKVCLMPPKSATSQVLRIDITRCYVSRIFFRGHAMPRIRWKVFQDFICSISDKKFSNVLDGRKPIITIFESVHACISESCMLISRAPKTAPDEGLKFAFNGATLF